MPLSLPASLLSAKNAIHSPEAWLLLAEIEFSALSPPVTLHLARNNEDVLWRGETWQAFAFELDDMEESSEGKVPSLALRVANVNRMVQGYVERIPEGGLGSPVTLYVAHSGNLAETQVPTFPFSIISVECSAMWVAIGLGAENPFLRRLPRNSFRANACRWRFRDARCGYAGAETVCGKTLARCLALANAERFGGFPGLVRRGFHVED